MYLLSNRGRVALRKRPDKGLLAGLWEFPNALEGDAPPLPLLDLEFAGTAKHIFTHIEWRMTAYAGVFCEDHLPPDWVWAGRDDLQHTYSVPSAFSGFFDAVWARLDENGGGAP